MYGVMVTFNFKERLTQEQIDAITDNVIEPMTHEPGFCHYYAIGDEAGKVGTFHVWDSKEQAESAVAKILPLLQPLIADLLLSAPDRIMSEVIYDSHKETKP